MNEGGRSTVAWVATQRSFSTSPQMSSVEPENETFWPSVVKHWNQALQNVRMLQKELFEVQTEVSAFNICYAASTNLS